MRVRLSRAAERKVALVISNCERHVEGGVVGWGLAFRIVRFTDGENFDILRNFTRGLFLLLSASELLRHLSGLEIVVLYLLVGDVRRALSVRNEGSRKTPEISHGARQD